MATKSARRDLPAGVTWLTGDVTDDASLLEAIRADAGPAPVHRGGLGEQMCAVVAVARFQLAAGHVDGLSVRG
jgi:hypothetical protein